MRYCGSSLPNSSALGGSQDFRGLLTGTVGFEISESDGSFKAWESMQRGQRPPVDSEGSPAPHFAQGFEEAEDSLMRDY
jgi:hypothetical protein